MSPGRKRVPRTKNSSVESSRSQSRHSSFIRVNRTFHICTSVRFNNRELAKSAFEVFEERNSDNKLAIDGHVTDHQWIGPSDAASCARIGPHDVIGGAHTWRVRAITEFRRRSEIPGRRETPVVTNSNAQEHCARMTRSEGALYGRSSVQLMFIVTCDISICTISANSRELERRHRGGKRMCKRISRDFPSEDGTCNEWQAVFFHGRS